MSSQSGIRTSCEFLCEAPGSKSSGVPVFLRTIPGIAGNGAEAYDKATLNFLPFDWISFGRHSVHATTKTRDTSSVVQIPMKRAFQDTSASAITAAILRVNQMRMAEAMHALYLLSAVGYHTLEALLTSTQSQTIA